jgi:hypothetical protein
MPEPRILLSDLILGESPRWHDGRLRFADWGEHRVLAVDLEADATGTGRVLTVDAPAPRAGAH